MALAIAPSNRSRLRLQPLRENLGAFGPFSGMKSNAPARLKPRPFKSTMFINLQLSARNLQRFSPGYPGTFH